MYVLTARLVILDRADSFEAPLPQPERQAATTREEVDCDGHFCVMVVGN
jgi:hypothetical protein